MNHPLKFYLDDEFIGKSYGEIPALGNTLVILGYEYNVGEVFIIMYKETMEEKDFRIDYVEVYLEQS